MGWADQRDGESKLHHTNRLFAFGEALSTGKGIRAAIEMVDAVEVLMKHGCLDDEPPPGVSGKPEEQKEDEMLRLKATHRLVGGRLVPNDNVNNNRQIPNNKFYKVNLENKDAFIFEHGISYRLLGTKEMTVKDWREVENNPRQRDVVVRINKGRADHLFALNEVHREVAMGVLPDMMAYKVDGHTRLAVWDAGISPAPDKLIVKIYACRDIAAIEELYDKYDNSAATEMGTDRVTGAYREAGIQPKTAMLVEGGISTAARQLYHYLGQTAPDKKTKDKSINACVTMFADEIMLLDQCQPTRALFPTGIIMGALLTLASQPQTALKFWTRYAAGNGVKMGEMDAVQALIERHSKERGKSNSRRDAILMASSVAAVRGFAKQKRWKVGGYAMQHATKEELRKYADHVLSIKEGS